MSSLSAFLQSKQASISSGIILATFWVFFAYAHLTGFQKTQNWVLLLFALAETLAAGFYVFRSTPKTVSVDPVDWLVGILGTLTALFFRPTSWGILPVASIAIVAGICIQILGFISLNRSFAIVAAKREIKTAWMYRIVRHPIYASYCLTFTGYLLVNTSLANLLIYLATMLLLCLRIFREERHLAHDAGYREYMRKVRYRLLPFIF